ncbi:hypothetical protein LCGC14_1552550 [marine sediment metagenome]|uniref:Uncharacterized protein n=2 Tax=root TaxID=1 RepID=A0A9C9NGL6_9HYPH|nr:hypothetical protein [Aurantimonas coralicida]
MIGREDLWAEIILNLYVGRDSAISIARLIERIRAHGSSDYSRLGLSTVRAHIIGLQKAGFGILTSPRVGVWMAADDDERLDVIEELRGQVHALERRMAAINQGKCALRTCRAELPEKVLRRRGLYCSPGHRYQAAIGRGKS